MIDDLAGYLDFANHNPSATEDEMMKLCSGVLKYGFNSAFMNPYWVSRVRDLVGGDFRVGTIVSFPLGQEFLDIKVGSAKLYAKNGADELDVSLNVSWIKEKRWDDCVEEMKRVVDAVKSVDVNKIVKFIPETGYLDENEIRKIAELMLSSGADFFKTCSGMGPRGAIIEDVRTVKDVVGDELKIKVAGGVSNYEQAVEFIMAGADRIGTSHAIGIVTKTNTRVGEGGGKLQE